MIKGQIKRRFSLSIRIFFSFFVLIAAFIVNAIVTYRVVEENTRLSDKIFINSNPSLQNLERLKLLVNEAKMYTTNWVFLPAKSTDKRNLKELHLAGYPVLREKLSSLSERWDSNQTDSLIQIYSTFESLLMEQKKIMDILVSFEDYEDPTKKMEAEYIVEDKVLPVTQQILNKINSLIEAKKLEIAQDEKQLVQSIQNLRALVISLAIILVIIALIFGFYMSRLIARPIVKIKEIVNKLGLGIIQSIPERKQKDEIADMIVSVNNLSKSLLYTSRFANEIGNGHFDAQFTPLSEDDTLGKSLIAMRDNLRRTSEQLREAQELTSNGSWEFDLKSKHVQFSEVSYKILGWNEEDKNPKIIDYLRIMHPEDLSMHLDKIELATTEGKSQTYDLRIIKRDGTVKNIQKIVKPIFDEKGKVVKLFGTILDIDERKRFEEALILARDSAEQATKIKSLFLSNMSHEMRTPMNAIIGLSDLLLEEKIDSSVREKLNSIKHSSENLLKIINEILDFSKIESGKITFEQVDFNLRELLEGIYKTFDFKARNQSLLLKISLASDVPVFLKGDPYRLNQILLNLVANAIKFTHHGFIELKVEKTKTNDQGVELKFSVTDTGIGIPEDKQKLIFESFSQAQNDHSRKYGGTGLGLSITKRLVELQNGTMGLQSTVGEGSSFFFTLSFSAGMEITPQEGHKIIDENVLKGLKLLLVEDNLMNQFVATQILKKWNVETETAINGKEALQILESKTFDIILMDLQMPEMDGYETTKIVRDLSSKVINHHTPIIAVSADAYEQTRIKALGLGMNGFVTKPINKQDLYDNLHSIFVQDKNSKSMGFTAEPVNHLHLLKITDHNRELAAEIIQLYLLELPGMMMILRNLASESDWYSITQITPKLISIFNNLGMKHTRKKIQQIEMNCLKMRDLSQLQMSIDELTQSSDKLYDELNQSLLILTSEKE